MMKVRSKYIAPQMSYTVLNEIDILTISFDGIDNWQPDPFGSEETDVIFRR